MTGKSAMRLGITRPISKNQKLGLGLEEKILPQYLKELIIALIYWANGILALSYLTVFPQEEVLIIFVVI